MSALLWLATSRAGQWLAAGVAAMAAIGAALFTARRGGMRDQAAREMAQRVEARNVRDAMDRDVARQPDPAGRLLDRWSRD
jgi:hypothetical protein